MSLNEENVKVIVRIRPVQPSESLKGEISCVHPMKDGREVQVRQFNLMHIMHINFYPYDRFKLVL